MESTACIKERLTLTLKSSLLCAVMLIPAVALADSPETDRVEQSTLDAVRIALSDTAAESSSPATSAQQRRISRLMHRHNTLRQRQLRHLQERRKRKLTRKRYLQRLMRLALIRLRRCLKCRKSSSKHSKPCKK